MYEVYVGKKARKFLNHLPEKTRNTLKTSLLLLKTNPVPVKEYDVKKISGFASAYRIRIGGFRILYDVDWTQKEINVAKIERRSESTYRK